MFKKLSILIAIIAGLVGIITNVIQFQHSCEPLSLGQCIAQWRDWIRTKQEDMQAASERERKRKTAEEMRTQALEAKRQADEAEAARKDAENRAAIATEERRKTEIEAARHRERQAAAAEAARREAEEQERTAAEQRRRQQAILEQQQRAAEEQKAREIERQRQLEERRRIAEQQRQQYLESIRCRNPGDGQYRCCPYGQTPEIRLNPVWKAGEPQWIGFCRAVDAN